MPLRRKWTSYDQIRYNAILALLRINPRSRLIQNQLFEVIHDKCGYVNDMAIEGLLIISENFRYAL